ncbi:MAG: transposase [Gemmatimonadetes bacterium]|nr:transposase [Gemmatimonadota bacterium]
MALPDIPCHITHRRNHRAEIFFSDEDRDVYRALLQEYCSRYRLEIRAYCFMTNHIHLIGAGRHPDSLARGTRPGPHALLPVDQQAAGLDRTSPGQPLLFDSAR